MHNCFGWLSDTYNWKFISQQQCKIVYKSLPCCCVCSIFIIVHSQGNVEHILHNAISIVECFWESTKTLETHVLKCVCVQEKEKYMNIRIYIYCYHVTVYHNINKI